MSEELKNTYKKMRNSAGLNIIYDKCMSTGVDVLGKMLFCVYTDVDTMEKQVKLGDKRFKITIEEIV
jgi:hypothetical protein